MDSPWSVFCLTLTTTTTLFIIAIPNAPVQRFSQFEPSRFYKRAVDAFAVFSNVNSLRRSLVKTRRLKYLAVGTRQMICAVFYVWVLYKLM